jgi:hypothetical protein
MGENPHPRPHVYTSERGLGTNIYAGKLHFLAKEKFPPNSQLPCGGFTVNPVHDFYMGRLDEVMLSSKIKGKKGNSLRHMSCY